VSKAFTKDDVPDAPPVARHRAPLPTGVANYVTPRGLEALRNERARLDGAPATDARARAAWRAELEDRLATAVVTAPPSDRSEIRFGARVRVRKADGELRDLQIVGVDEAAPHDGRIAFVAPLARALLGRRVGDPVTVRAPSGQEELEIVSVDYSP
jgi:transcription elongation factor GreB